MDEVWTVEAVAERFVDAARTARRLPRVAVQGYPCQNRDRSLKGDYVEQDRIDRGIGPRN
jgi:hypothetical protein